MFLVVQEYQIDDRIGCIQSDNTSNNNTIIKSLHKQIPKGLDANNHLFYTGHIINLVVKAILFGEGVSAFK